MSITEETRREAYAAIQPKIAPRASLILTALEDSPMTASELARQLFELGLVWCSDRNMVAPRLTELKAAGLVEVCGRRKSLRSNATEAVWRAVTQ